MKVITMLNKLYIKEKNQTVSNSVDFEKIKERGHSIGLDIVYV